LPLSRWILDAANRATQDAGAALDAFRPNDYAAACYRFAWGDFCDWFLEFAKPGFTGDDAGEIRDVAAYVLGILLRLMHPMMPFVTEELWGHFGYGAEGSLIRAAWPQAVAVHDAQAAVAEVAWVVDLISQVRTVRSEMNVPPSVKSPILLQDASAASLARASEIGPLEGDVPRGSAQVVLGEATLVLPLAEIIDLDAERARLSAARAKAAAELEKVRAKLANEDFVKRAPEAILAEHEERRESFSSEILRLDAALQRIA
jgi:valyl-tRNA synthetase